MAKTEKTEQEEPLKVKLWKTADKLRKNMDSAEYKHVVLGLISLIYIRRFRITISKPSCSNKRWC